MKYSTTYQITSAQMDGRYRLTVDGILTFHENTIARYLTTLGLAAFDLQKQDRTWVISEINLEMPAPPTMWTEDIEVQVWVSEMSSLRIWMEFTMKEVHSGVLAARGNSCWSVISMSERKLLSCEGLIPDAELIPELAAGPHKKRAVMKFQNGPINTLQHSVNLIDLDFNGHTTNRRYVQLALVCFEPSFLEAYRPDSLNIRFIHESRMGDELVCQTHPADAPQTFVGRIINGYGQEICKISSQWVKRFVTSNFLGHADTAEGVPFDYGAAAVFGVAQFLIKAHFIVAAIQDCGFEAQFAGPVFGLLNHLTSQSLAAIFGQDHYPAQIYMGLVYGVQTAGCYGQVVINNDYVFGLRRVVFVKLGIKGYLVLAGHGLDSDVVRSRLLGSSGCADYLHVGIV